MKRSLLITGAAGGIGQALVSLFVREDWQVIGVDKEKVSKTLAGVTYLQEDLLDPAAFQRIFGYIEREIGSLNAIVNNAAIQICCPITQMSDSEWQMTIDANLRSSFLSIRHGYRLLQKPGGSIVNISSVHAVATSDKIAAYAASKGALLSFTRALAIEFGRDGVRVNALLPGAVDTPMLRFSLSRGHAGEGDVEKQVFVLGSKTVLGRVGRPEEIAKAALFLVDSTWSSYITGQALVVDGGALARLSIE